VVLGRVGTGVALSARMLARRPCPLPDPSGLASRSVARWILTLILAQSPAAWSAARPVADAVPGRRIDRLVAGSTRLFAVRGGQVVTFDEGGQPIGRCGGFAAAPQREPQPRIGAPDAEEVLRAAGLPDDDSTPEAEDALADERMGPPRPAPRTSPTGVVPRALAAVPAADAIWIATSSGIFRGDESGCEAAGLAGRDLVAVAASDRVVIAASDDLLFRREAAQDDDEGRDEGRDKRPDDDGRDDDEDDGGATFLVAAGLTTRPRALAVEADGEAIVADDDGISIVGPENSSTRILDRATDALAVCGGVAAALSSDGVYTWSPGVPPARVGDRPPAHALACGRTAAERWIATGLGVWTSADGSSWIERVETLGRSVAGSAVVGDRLWLAADDGLVALDLSAPPDLEGTPAAGGAVGASTGGGWAALPTRRWLAPAIPWPWVTAALGAERTPVRQVWTVMVLLTFPLGRLITRIDPTSLADELVRRDQALVVEETDLRAAPHDDEVDARLAALRQEREALR
jgi:hypothetical protein